VAKLTKSLATLLACCCLASYIVRLGAPQYTLRAKRLPCSGLGGRHERNLTRRLTALAAGAKLDETDRSHKAV
jgi:hypothetical protein